jgi:hypothetical protein
VALAVVIVLSVALGGYASATAQVSGTTYTSPTFGYTVTWQSPWYLVDVGDDPEYDSFSIVDSDSFVYFAGSSDGSTPQGVVDSFAGYIQSEPAYSNIQPLAQCATRPSAAASSCYRYDHSYDDGTTLPEGVLIEAYDMGGGVNLLMVASVDEGLFPTYLPLWAQFGVFPAGQAPVSETTGGQTEEVHHGVTFLFDPAVTPEHRADVLEGIRLGQQAIGQYLGFTDLGNLRITVLDSADSQDPYLMAATLGSSIVVYTGGPAWQNAPPIVRIETMVHELTHVYQGMLTEDSRTNVPIWFIEGSAEAIGFLATTQLGVIDQNDVYELELYWLTEYPVSGSLGALQANASMNVDTYPLAYIAVQYLLARSGLSVTSLGEVYSALASGVPFAEAFTSAFGIAPDAFYTEFDAWRVALKKVYEIPDDFWPTEGAAQAANATWIHAPAEIAVGQQLILVVSTLPAADCSASVQLSGQTIQRDTFANDEGEAFWLVTIPEGSVAGPGSASVSCGSTPVETIFSVT